MATPDARTEPTSVARGGALPRAAPSSRHRARSQPPRTEYPAAKANPSSISPLQPWRAAPGPFPALPPAPKRRTSCPGVQLAFRGLLPLARRAANRGDRREGTGRVCILRSAPVVPIRRPASLHPPPAPSHPVSEGRLGPCPGTGLRYLLRPGQRRREERSDGHCPGGGWPQPARGCGHGPSCPSPARQGQRGFVPGGVRGCQRAVSLKG